VSTTPDTGATTASGGSEDDHIGIERVGCLRDSRRSVVSFNKTHLGWNLCGLESDPYGLNGLPTSLLEVTSDRFFATILG